MVGIELETGLPNCSNVGARCNVPLPSTMMIIPCMWFGIAINSSNIKFFRISSPNWFNTILLSTTSPKTHSLLCVHIVIKYAPVCE